jgi:hypothetical protein
MVAAVHLRDTGRRSELRTLMDPSTLLVVLFCVAALFVVR